MRTCKNGPTSQKCLYFARMSIYWLEQVEEHTRLQRLELMKAIKTREIVSILKCEKNTNAEWVWVTFLEAAAFSPCYIVDLLHRPLLQQPVLLTAVGVTRLLYFLQQKSQMSTKHLFLGELSQSLKRIKKSYFYKDSWHLCHLRRLKCVSVELFS